MDYSEYSVVIGNAELIFCIGNDIAWECESYKSEPHFHSYHEITYLCRGELEITAGDETTTAKAGDVVIIPEKLIHGLYSKERHYRLTVSVNIRKTKRKSFDMYGELCAVLSDKRIFSASDAELGRAFERLLSYYYGKADCKYELIKAVLTEITVLLKNALSASGGSASEMKDQTDGYRVFVIEQYLHAKFAAGARAKELAEMLNLSVCQTERVFLKIYSVPLREKILQMRMIHAKNLLENTDMSPSQISAECGYAAPHGFFAAFARYCGKTPTEYRNMIKKSGGKSV